MMRRYIQYTFRITAGKVIFFTFRGQFDLLPIVVHRSHHKLIQILMSGLPYNVENYSCPSVQIYAVEFHLPQWWTQSFCELWLAAWGQGLHLTSDHVEHSNKTAVMKMNALYMMDVHLWCLYFGWEIDMCFHVVHFSGGRSAAGFP